MFARVSTDVFLARSRHICEILLYLVVSDKMLCNAIIWTNERTKERKYYGSGSI